MSGRIPREMSPCPSLGARKGSEKNWPRSPRLIPKSSSILESSSRMRNLFPPISPTPPRSWIFTMMRPVLGPRTGRIMVNIQLLGEVGEIGGNKFLIRDEDSKILLDFGMSLGLRGQFFSEPFLAP